MELNITILVQMVIFLSLLLWLSRFLFAPIMRLFDEREIRIDGAKREALELDRLAEDREKTFASEYDRAKDQARQALSEMKQGLDKEYGETIDRVKELAKANISAAQRQILEQEAEVRRELMASVEEIADEILASLQVSDRER